MTTNTLFIVLIFLGIIIIILLYENTSTRIIFHGYGSTTDSKLFARSHNRVQLTSNNAVSGFYHIRTYEYNVSNSDYQLTMKTGPYSMLTTKIRPIEMLTTKKLLNGCGSQRPDNMSDSEFCKEVSRRLHWGLVDYALWDGDPELKQLVQPLFKNKRLVVWSLDHHAMAIAELRSIIESFGVEFIEHSVLPLHTRRPGVCSPPLCLCSQSTNLTPDPSLNPLFPTKDLFDKVARDPLAAPDIARADAFLVSVSIPIIELYMRYNRSIIAVAATRFEYTLYRDTNRWHKMNEQLRTLLQKRHHVIGGNSLYEVEYMYYYMGARPDYIPGFGVYTGEHYHPTRMSFLYARRPKVYKVGSFWTDPFDRQYRLINAKFVIKSIMELYPPLCGGGYTLFDLAQHLGIVHLPYQVPVFLLQYSLYFDPIRVNTCIVFNFIQSTTILPHRFQLCHFLSNMEWASLCSRPL